MRNRSVNELLVAAALLVNLIWLADDLTHSAGTRREARLDKLAAELECEPLFRCLADFDGDGLTDHLSVEQFKEYGDRWLVARASGRELLRLPFDSTDGKLRTHVAMTRAIGHSRLLIYDGVNYSTPLRAVYAWDGERLSETTPNEIESEALDAMAARDFTGGWAERVRQKVFRGARVFCYLVTLAGLLGVALYRKFLANAALP